jgi:hypothetical protein
VARALLPAALDLTVQHSSASVGSSRQGRQNLPQPSPGCHPEQSRAESRGAVKDPCTPRGHHDHSEAFSPQLRALRTGN